PDFTKAAALLAYGPDSAPLKENRICITQSISGTGALRIGGAFLQRFYPGAKAIYIPTPSWANHKAVFTDSGLEVKQYRYYNKDTIGLDFDGMVEDIKKMPKGSIVLLHACAHNPTGVDPTEAQWKAISDAVKEGEHYPFFDMAYQGFASGDTNKDAFALRYFLKEGHLPCLAQSFAKNMGLYGERVGAFSIVTASEEEKARVDSQLKILVRPLYSNPPVHGARIASTILNDASLNKQWLGEVKGMADRIIQMRALLKQNLDKEYAGITGVPDFTKAAALLAYGPDSAPLKENRICITQSISGTGALRIGGAFLQRFYPGAKAIYIPTPS
ncbi:hypothetical protein D0862_15327, partial [Hortaea werneckii]